jgi:hypothetical protein
LINFLCWLAMVCELSRVGIKPMEGAGDWPNASLPLSDNDPARPDQMEYG